ncbi:MAG: hypothetical protein K1X89_21260 [Myxococcaceae bacterium]|nr:hypothetical protein [Myxococcaceae bacterium]
MSATAPPYWQLISVLVSTQPLSSELAMTLYRVALDLHEREASVGTVDLPTATGQVTNTRRHAMLGTIGGPMFEAELETERGKGMVRYLLTREALATMPSATALPN